MLVGLGGVLKRRRILLGGLLLEGCEMEKGEMIKVNGLTLEEVMILMADTAGGNFYIKRVGSDVYAVKD